MELFSIAGSAAIAANIAVVVVPMLDPSVRGYILKKMFVNIDICNNRIRTCPLK